MATEQKKAPIPLFIHEFLNEWAKHAMSTTPAAAAPMTIAEAEADGMPELEDPLEDITQNRELMTLINGHGTIKDPTDEGLDLEDDMPQLVDKLILDPEFKTLINARKPEDPPGGGFSFLAGDPKASKQFVVNSFTASFGECRHGKPIGEDCPECSKR
jgi:hypothetical protein